jgi:hypothetical protein
MSILQIALNSNQIPKSLLLEHIHQARQQLPLILQHMHQARQQFPPILQSQILCSQFPPIMQYQQSPQIMQLLIWQDIADRTTVVTSTQLCASSQI